MIEKMSGTPWKPVPGRNTLKIPTNIEEDGTILNEAGDVDGYAEENENIDERFNPEIGPEEDESFRKNQEEEKEKQNRKRRR